MKKQIAWIVLAISLFVLSFYTSLPNITAGSVLGLYRLYAPKFFLSLAVVASAMVIKYYVFPFLVRNISTVEEKEDAIKIMDFALVIIAIIALAAVVFENVLLIATSLGFIGLGLAYALQQPILSIFGWFYVVLKKPYQIGDRIELGSFRGDVAEIGLFATTLLEFGGTISSDQPSGRQIKFPNSMPLLNEVINYTTNFPFVWNETTFRLDYESDINLALSTIEKEAEKIVGDKKAMISKYQKELENGPVPDLTTASSPDLIVFPDENWIRVDVRYLVSPRRTTTTRNNINSAVIKAFYKDPKKLRFAAPRMDVEMKR